MTSFRSQRTLGLLLSRKRTDWVYKPSLQFWREPFLARDRYIFAGTSLFTRPITSMENFHESGEEINYDSPGSSETDKSDTDSHDIFENLLGPASPFGSPYKTYYNISDSIRGTSLDPKTRILLHLIALAVLTSAAKRIPKFKPEDMRKYVEAAVIERCGAEEIEQTLLHAEYGSHQRSSYRSDEFLGLTATT